MKKSVLRSAIVQQLQQELARQTSAAQLSRDEAISEESRAENKWDTHSQEAAYLAEGQAKLAAEIGANIELYTSLALQDFGSSDPIAIGAFIELETVTTPPKRSWYFLGPRSGGLEVTVNDKPVLVLTPQSPLGRKLLGRRVGDLVQSAGRVVATQRIVAVS